MKNYSPSMRSALTGTLPHEFVHLVEIQFAGSTLRMTDGQYNVTHDGYTWAANGLLTSVDDVRQEQQLSAQEIELTFSNVDQTILATLLNEEQRNRLVIIKRVILTPTTNSTLGELFSCRYRINSYAVEEATVSITLRGAVSDFYAVKGIVTTHDSIRRFHPENTSFINASSVNDKQKWGGQ